MTTGERDFLVPLPSLLLLLAISLREGFMNPGRVKEPIPHPVSQDWAVAFVTRHQYLRRVAERRSVRISSLLSKAGDIGNAYAISARSLMLLLCTAVLATAFALVLWFRYSPFLGLVGLLPLVLYYGVEVRLRDRISQRREGIEKELPFFSILVNVLGSAGVPLYAILEGITESKLFTRIRMEALLVKRDVEVFGIDPNESLERLASNHPSRKFSSFLNGYCYDEETETLTDEGWKRFVDLEGHEKILALDPAANIATFVKPSLYHKKYYEGLVYEAKDSNHNFVVTPQHKMFCKAGHKENTPFRLCPIEEMVGWREASVSAYFRWQGNKENMFVLPRVESKRGRSHSQNWVAEERRIGMRDWLQFLGWFVSEGCVERGYCTSIVQKKQENMSEIEELLARCGFKATKDFNRKKQAWRFRIHSEQLSTWLLENCYSSSHVKTSYTKRVPAFVKDLAPELIDIFMSSLWKGDGTNSGGHRRYATYSKKLADDVQELLLKCGRTANVYRVRDKVLAVATHQVYEQCSKTMAVDCRKVAKRWYRGMIGCVEVPSHIVMVRRRGHPMWSGNTSKVRSGGDMPSYLAGESGFLLRELEEGWSRYASRAGMIGSMMITVFGVIPLLLLVVGMFSPKVSVLGLTAFTGVGVPLFTVFLVYLAGRMQPVGERAPTGRGLRSLLLSIPGFGLAALANQLWLSAASGLFLFLVVYGFSVKDQLREMREMDEALPDFLKDLLEYKRQEYDLAKSLVKIAQDRSYSPTFDALMAQVTTQVRAGVPVDELSIDPKTRLAEMVFFVLGQMGRSGGGTVDTVYQLSAYTSKVVEMKHNARAEMRPYLMLSYLSPLLLAFGVAFVGGLLKSFSRTVTPGLSTLHLSSLQVGTMPPEMYEVSSLLIVVSASALGIIGAKMTDFTVRNTLRASANVVVAVVATFALSQFGFTGLFHIAT